MFLAGNKGKSFTQFQQEELQVSNNGLLQFAFMQFRRVRQIKKLKHHGRFQHVNRTEFFTRQPFAISRQQPVFSMMSKNPLIV